MSRRRVLHPQDARILRAMHVIRREKKAVLARRYGFAASTVYGSFAPDRLPPESRESMESLLHWFDSSAYQIFPMGQDIPPELLPPIETALSTDPTTASTAGADAIMDAIMSTLPANQASTDGTVIDAISVTSEATEDTAQTVAEPRAVHSVDTVRLVRAMSAFIGLDSSVIERWTGVSRDDVTDMITSRSDVPHESPDSHRAMIRWWFHAHRLQVDQPITASSDTTRPSADTAHRKLIVQFDSLLDAVDEFHLTYGV